MSIRQAMLFVPRRLLASCSGPVAAPLASSAADNATAPIKQRDPGWAPLSAAAATASGAASPLGVAAVLVAPKRNKPHLVVKPPPVGWKPAPKPLPMGIVPSSALRKAPARGKTLVVSSQTMHRTVLHLTADCRASASAAPPPAATVSGGVCKRRTPGRVLGMLSRSLMLVGALLIAAMPPVLTAMTGPQARPSGEERPLFSELWHSRAWRLFPLLLAYMAGVTLLIPHVPGIMTDYFAGRRAGHALHCEGMAKDAPDAASCRDAHADVVMWSSWTSFFSNSFVSIVLTPLLGHWSDLHGRKPFFLVAQACACIPLTIVLLHLTSGLPLLWYYVVQVFLSAVSSVTVALSFIADSLSPRNRAASFGLIMACFSVAIFIGPPVGAMMPPLTAALCALGTVAGCALYTLLLLPESLTPEAKASAQRRHREQQHAHHAGGGGSSAMHPALGSTLRAVRILMRSPLFKKLTVTMMITGVVLEGLQDLLVQYLQLKLDFGVADVSRIFMIFGGCGLLVQTLVLRTLLGCMGEQRVLLVALLASSGQQLLLALAGHKWVAFLGISLGSLGSMSFPTISSIKSCNAAEHEQGSVQGALYGARALASGTGPLVFAFLFSAFTQTGSPLPYFPGAPFIFGALLMLVAVGVAATIPSNAGSHRPAAPAHGHHEQQQEQPWQQGEQGAPDSSAAPSDCKDGPAAWPAGEEGAQPSGRTSRCSVDLEGGGPSERTRLLG